MRAVAEGVGVVVASGVVVLLHVRDGHYDGLEGDEEEKIRAGLRKTKTLGVAW